MALDSIKPRNNRGVMGFGLGVGLLVGAGLMLAMLVFPASIPAALVFVFSISPLFAWAQGFASIAVIAASSILIGVLATTAAKLVVMLGQGLAWCVSGISTALSPCDEKPVAETGLDPSFKPSGVSVTRLTDTSHGSSSFFSRKQQQQTSECSSDPWLGVGSHHSV